MFVPLLPHTHVTHNLVSCLTLPAKPHNWALCGFPSSGAEEGMCASQQEGRAGN